jgi:hypothetical protein
VMHLRWNFVRLNVTSVRAGALVLAAAAIVDPARAVDEIQLYNAEIAEVGQFTVQQHFNYTFIGRTQAEFPGGLVPNHALNATPEFDWGITKWFEFGLYIPWAVNAEDQFLSNAFKLRTLFVTPDAAKKDFFYGLNFEYDFPTPPFGQTRFAMEIRPIIGWRNPQWEFIVNPILDLSFGQLGDIDFVPAARLARKLGEDFFIGVEYYTDLGAPGSFPSFQQQQHQVFGVVDSKVGEIDVDFGVGHGITSGSDRLVAKTILSYAFPVPGKAQGDKSSLNVPLTLRAEGLRATSAANIAADPFLGMR